MLERVQSQAIAQALAEPSMTAALARGLSYRQMLWRHAWRLGAKPVAARGGPHRRHAAQRLVRRRARHVVAGAGPPHVRRPGRTATSTSPRDARPPPPSSSSAASSRRTCCWRRWIRGSPWPRRLPSTRCGREDGRTHGAGRMARGCGLAPWLAPNDPGCPLRRARVRAAHTRARPHRLRRACRTILLRAGSRGPAPAALRG